MYICDCLFRTRTGAEMVRFIRLEGVILTLCFCWVRLAIASLNSTRMPGVCLWVRVSAGVLQLRKGTGQKEGAQKKGPKKRSVQVGVEGTERADFGEVFFECLG